MSKWEKHEPIRAWVKVGDGPKDVKEVQGVLARIIPNQRYPANLDYVLHDGEKLVAVRESASIKYALDFQDYGKPVKIQFSGWMDTKNGNRMKQIEVFKMEGPYTPDVLAAFPKAGKYAAPNGTKESLRAAPEEDPFGGVDEDGEDDAPTGDDDDLPF